MYRVLLSTALGVSVLAMPFAAGCDRKVEETHTEQKKADGSTVTHDSSTVQKPDGTVVEKKKDEVK